MTVDLYEVLNSLKTRQIKNKDRLVSRFRLKINDSNFDLIQYLGTVDSVNLRLGYPL